MAGKRARRPADGTYSRAWRNVSKIILRPGIRMMMRLDWHGQENIPADGPVILAANHLSYMDIFAVSLFADSARRYPVFLAKSSLFTIPIVGPVITRLGQLPVYRGQADAALVLKQAAELAARNSACVIFYPEATVTRDPQQWPMVAKTGVARLALEQNIPVVPIAHWGAQRILPYGKFVPKLLPRKTVQIVAGPPVDLSEFAGQPLSNAVLRASHRQDHDRRHGAAWRTARSAAARGALPPGDRPPQAASGPARPTGSKAAGSKPARRRGPSRREGTGSRDRCTVIRAADQTGRESQPGTRERSAAR